MSWKNNFSHFDHQPNLGIKGSLLKVLDQLTRFTSKTMFMDIHVGETLYYAKQYYLKVDKAVF